MITERNKTLSRKTFTKTDHTGPIAQIKLSHNVDIFSLTTWSFFWPVSQSWWWIWTCPTSWLPCLLKALTPERSQQRVLCHLSCKSFRKEFEDQNQAPSKGIYARKNCSGAIVAEDALKQLSTEAWQIAPNPRKLQAKASAAVHALSRLCRWSLSRGHMRTTATCGVHSGGNHQSQKHQSIILSSIWDLWRQYRYQVLCWS